MKKLTLVVLVLVAVGVGAGVYTMRRNQPEPTVTTLPLTRGDIVDTVGATGTLEAVETVDVGTQVSGVVQQLFADFNSIVRKGQVIAKLDPSLIETQIEQQTANVIRAEADLERLNVNLADMQQKLDRAQQMAAKNLIPRTELETAEVNVKSAEAQIRSSQAALTQVRAQLNSQRVNLGYTTIVAPIDGIVISRNVDQGQTVAASMNAPTLFIIAADLTKMQVVANIDEADVGRMRPGQHVTFRVDAFPTDTFTGTVQQVRLQPAVVQNVVTYSTVISVPNPELKLKPGMTANVNIEIARRSDVLRIPNAALRFRPTNEMFAALNQPVPPELQRGAGGFAGRGRTPGGEQAGGAQTPARGAGGSQAAPAAQSAPAGTSQQGAAPPAQPGSGPQAGAPRAAEGRDTPSARESRGGGDQPGGEARAEGRGFGGRGGFDPNMTPEERQRRRDEMLKNMTPEQRERFEARMREGGGRGFGGGGNAGSGGGSGAGVGRSAGGNREGAQERGRSGSDARPGGTAPGRTAPAAAPQSRTLASGATTIDSLFGPLPTVESRGTAWLYVNKQLKMVRLRLGITDGTYTEVINAEELQPNMEVVTMMTTGLEPRATTGQGGSQNPLMGPQRGPGGRGPGGGGGGGRGGGRG